MDRATAARLLGVGVDASRTDVDTAFRARVRHVHPDRFAAGSAEWHRAADETRLLAEARRALRPSPAAGHARPAGRAGWTGVTEDGVRYATSPVGGHRAPAARPPVFRTLPEAYRRARNRALLSGAGLLGAAGASAAVGATQPVNSAFPVWTPGLASVGCVSLLIGAVWQRRLASLRAGDRQRTRGPRR